MENERIPYLGQVLQGSTLMPVYIKVDQKSKTFTIYNAKNATIATYDSNTHAFASFYPELTKQIADLVSQNARKLDTIQQELSGIERTTAHSKHPIKKTDITHTATVPLDQEVENSKKSTKTTNSSQSSQNKLQDSMEVVKEVDLSNTYDNTNTLAHLLDIDDPHSSLVCARTASGDYSIFIKDSNGNIQSANSILSKSTYGISSHDVYFSNENGDFVNKQLTNTLYEINSPYSEGNTLSISMSDDMTVNVEIGKVDKDTRKCSSF
jgi:hypothetical protein